MKVLYGSSSGFHAVDLDSASVYDIYLPKHAQVGEKINQFYEIFGGSEIQFDNQILPKGPVTPHTIVTLPNTNGMQLLLCYDNEGVYVNTYGKVRDYITTAENSCYLHPGVEEHCATVGRAADQCCLHWNRPDHGLGEQGH